jgi:hypothetical protein
MDDQSDSLDRLADRYVEEAGGDLALAFRLLSYDYLYACTHVSRGLARVAPMARSGFPAKPARVKPLDIPQPSSPAARNPSA